MSNGTNCPNCGAILTRNTCDFCGTQIFDFTSISDEHPAYIKVYSGGRIMQFKALLNSVSIRLEDDPWIYVDNNPKHFTRGTTGCVSLKLNMVYDDGILFKTIDKEE